MSFSIALFSGSSNGLMLSGCSVATRHTAASAVRMAESQAYDATTLDRYLNLPVQGKVQAEYLWVDAAGEVRSKCRTVDSSKATVEKLPDWNYDGSSTGQAPGDDSEVKLPEIRGLSLP